MRCNLDGSRLETLIEAGREDADLPGSEQMVRRADLRPKVWTDLFDARRPGQCGLGRIFSANVEIPAGQTAQSRSDIEVFFDKLPEPIDLELDHKNRVLAGPIAATLRAATQ